MITKIKSIDNFAVFDNFRWDNSVVDADGHALSFAKLNILYGRNYSGKTTLSRIVRSLETHKLPEKYINPQFELVFNDGSQITQTTINSANNNIRVFNEDFVRTDLRFLIDPDGEIAPFAILGENAKIKEDIDELEAEIGSNTEGQETGLYKQLKNEEKMAQTTSAAFTSASSALESKLSNKALNRQNGIKYNADRFGDQNYTIAKIKNDISCVTAQGYVDLTAQQKTEHENMIREETKPPIPKIPVPDLQIKTYCDKAVELLSREICSTNKIAELLRDAILSEWVKKGKSLHEGKSICAFCGSHISDARWNELNAHFDEESKKLESDIDTLLSEIKLEKERLQKPLNIDKTSFYAKYYNEVDSLINAASEATKEYCSALDNIYSQLQARKAQIINTFQFIKPIDNSATISKLFEDFEMTRTLSEAFSSGLRKAKEIAQKALRLQEVADFCTTIGYASEMTNISTSEDKKDASVKVVENTKNLLKSKNNELQAKRRQLNDEEEGAKRVNKYLNDYFGHNFVSLEAEKVTENEPRIRFRIMRNGNPAFNLSEGECSLISFCYFMAKLDDIDTIGKKPIIWIDDPISSLDSNHIFFMYSLIVAKITKTGNFDQLFISTHSLDFLKYLRRLKSYQLGNNGKLQAVPKQYFFVEREGNLSKIKKMPRYLIDNATEFNYLFSIIYKCSKCESVTDENYDMLFGFGNNARKFLELLLYFQYPDDSEELLPKLKRFFGEEEIPPVLLDRMFNEDSHGSSPERAFNVDIDPETIPVAKKLIEKLRENADQYSALMKSIGEPIEN